MACPTCKASDEEVKAALYAGLVCESEPHCELGLVRKRRETFGTPVVERACGCDCGGCDA